MRANFPSAFAVVAGYVLLPAAVCGQEFTLHDIVAAGQSSVVRQMIATGANVNAQDEMGDTPLHIAAMYDQPRIALLLLAAGAEIDATNRHGQTVLHVTAAWNSTVIARLLLERGADESRLDNFGNTAAGMAQAFGARDWFDMVIVRQALSMNASANTRQIRLPPPTTQYIQRVLSGTGHYSGKLDGLLGPQTRQAIQAFQEWARVPVAEPSDTSPWIGSDFQKALWLYDDFARRQSDGVGVPSGCHVCLTRVWYRDADGILQSAGGCGGPAALLEKVSEGRRAYDTARALMSSVGDFVEVLYKFGPGCPAP